MSLLEHPHHKHTPRNVNELHKAEHGLNTRIAVTLTRIVGSMPTAYVFALLALVGLFAILGWLSPIVVLLVAWLSQTFLQLVFLPILSVGQNVLGRHQELQAEEQFATTQKSYHDIEQIMQHLEAQDAELLRQSTMLLELMEQTKRPQPTSKLKAVRVIGKTEQVNE